ncbi:hypothetical protein J6590_101913 [Homalodisca vitripennis]|nr:hypothetical protein J6590_101913 [Homalodisca vitripennis]
MELSTKLSSLEKHGEPTPKMAIKELTRKAGYRILEAKKVDTKFDRKAVMLLVEVDSTKTAVTFLPQHRSRKAKKLQLIADNAGRPAPHVQPYRAATHNSSPWSSGQRDSLAFVGAQVRIPAAGDTNFCSSAMTPSAIARPPSLS